MGQAQAWPMLLVPVHPLCGRLWRRRRSLRDEQRRADARDRQGKVVGKGLSHSQRATE
jgi:hypothetical protein